MSDDWWRNGVPPETVDLIREWEGYSSIPYICPSGVWTIGYGSTRGHDGRPVTALTPPITEQQATAMALRDLEDAARLVARAFPDGLPKRWAVALISMSQNMGDPQRWGPTLVRMLRARDYTGAARQMSAYIYAAGRPLLGLLRRRWAEAAYAMGMTARDASAIARQQIRSLHDWPAIPNGQNRAAPDSGRA